MFYSFRAPANLQWQKLDAQRKPTPVATSTKARAAYSLILANPFAPTRQ